MYKFKQNKYADWYYSIINKAITRNLTKEVEQHHIIPKSLNGLNNKTNLVPLTYREHFIVHLLLIKMVADKDVYKMVQAIVRFKHKATNSGEYKLLRKFVSRYSTGKYNQASGKIWIYCSDSKEIKFIDKAQFDSSVHTKGLPYQRGGHKGYVWINNGKQESMISRDNIIPNKWISGRLNKASLNHMKAMSAKRHTKEKDKIHSEKMKGKNHFNYGKPGVTKGRVWINNGIRSKLVNKESLLEFKNWKRGRQLR